MGYDADIVVFKKRTLENIQKIFPEFTFHELYTDYLFTRIDPKAYDVPEDEKATWIFSPSVNIFYDFFEFQDRLENGEARIIEKDTYLHFIIGWKQN